MADEEDRHYVLSRCLSARIDWLFNQLASCYGIGAAYFCTRESRYPEFVDKRASRVFNGLPLAYTLTLRNSGMDRYYNNDDMFQLVIIDTMHNKYYISVNAYDINDDANMSPDMIRIVYYNDEETVLEEFPLRDIVWNWIQCCVLCKMAAERTALFKEELVAAAWHPQRIEQWLTAGVAIDDC